MDGLVSSWHSGWWTENFYNCYETFYWSKISWNLTSLGTTCSESTDPSWNSKEGICSVFFFFGLREIKSHTWSKQWSQTYHCDFKALTSRSKQVFSWNSTVFEYKLTRRRSPYPKFVFFLSKTQTSSWFGHKECTDTLAAAKDN